MNFIEEYVQYATEFTDSPPVFHHRVALSILSTIANRNVWLTQGHKKVYPNLWLLVIAPSSFYRKSYSLSIAEDLIREAGDGLILPREFSHEKLLENLQKQPKGLLVFYEFKTFMGLMSRDYMSGTKSLITELFDCPQLYDRDTIKGGKISIQEPFLNIMAASTMDWLITSIKDEDLAGGFIPRFLVVMAPKKEKIMPFQPPADMDKRFMLIDSLARIGEINGEMKFDAAAIKFYEDWYIKFERTWDQEPMLSPFYARLTEYAKKLAMILTLDRRRSLTITEEDCRLACALADTFARSMHGMVTDNLSITNGHRQRRKIEELIKAEHLKGIMRRDLLRNSKMSSKELDHILETLIQEEHVLTQEIQSEESSGKMTRMKKQYFWSN